MSGTTSPLSNIYSNSNSNSSNSKFKTSNGSYGNNNNNFNVSWYRSHGYHPPFDFWLIMHWVIMITLIIGYFEFSLKFVIDDEKYGEQIFINNVNSNYNNDNIDDSNNIDDNINDNIGDDDNIGDNSNQNYYYRNIFTIQRRKSTWKFLELIFCLVVIFTSIKVSLTDTSDFKVIKEGRGRDLSYPGTKGTPIVVDDLMDMSTVEYLSHRQQIGYYTNVHYEDEYDENPWRRPYYSNPWHRRLMCWAKEFRKKDKLSSSWDSTHHNRFDVYNV
ncbi:2884_t:CDS:2 [Entrophospora sp. SA101]|nr:8121_t:CDS:2 [Entrophospora sp. SA101]CAJ0766584.1 2884_t:CDS:2 [Entrophospora sp. SA101]